MTLTLYADAQDMRNIRGQYARVISNADIARNPLNPATPAQKNFTIQCRPIDFLCGFC